MLHPFITVDKVSLFCMHTDVHFIDIRFNTSTYTVSEDDSFVDLTMIRNLTSDAVSATENITVHFSTSDWTAKGTCRCTILSVVTGCICIVLLW